MISALGEVAIEGVKTNDGFSVNELLNSAGFSGRKYHHRFIPQHYPDL